ncbi:HU family DNA-binding protein, partial [Gammaproteobacteria bacterium]|nr:HU family DNA-binding protein [Gammaproteobacteria bacterium]
MNKAEIINTVAEKSNLTKLQAEDAFSAIFDTISSAMIDNKVMIPGFGAFITKVRSERKGRNPSTGQ